MTKIKAVVVPAKMPRDMKVADHAKLKDQIKPKFIPPQPKPGDVTLHLTRPQTASGFLEYAKGEIISLVSHPGDSYIVTVARPGFSRGGEGWKKWEQLVNARPATPAEVEYMIAAQRVGEIRFLLGSRIDDRIDGSTADALRAELADIESQIG